MEREEAYFKLFRLNDDGSHDKNFLEKVGFFKTRSADWDLFTRLACTNDGVNTLFSFEETCKAFQKFWKLGLSKQDENSI